MTVRRPDRWRCVCQRATRTLARAPGTGCRAAASATLQLQCDADRLYLGVSLNALTPNLPSPARLFVSAEGERVIEPLPAVDAHHNGSYLERQLLSDADIARPDV